MTAETEGAPLIKTMPLPAGAQFLNVIESVFSGMARAIIHNSDYSSVMTATKAIDRYIEERNAIFVKIHSVPVTKFGDRNAFRASLPRNTIAKIRTTCFRSDTIGPVSMTPGPPLWIERLGPNL